MGSECDAHISVIFYWIWHIQAMEVTNQENQLESLTSSRDLQSEKSETRSITRKPNRLAATPLFKKRKEQPTGPLPKDKRFRSTDSIRFLKTKPAEPTTLFTQAKYCQDDEELLRKTAPSLTESHQLPLKTSEQNSDKVLVFNKFSLEERKQIRQYISLLKDQKQKSKLPQELGQVIDNIRYFIEQLEDNNRKLLEVNYFFQKEFSKSLKDKERLKKTEKCNKSYCLECRYHLEKENKWKKEKKEMARQLAHLQAQIASTHTKGSANSSTASFSDSPLLETAPQISSGAAGVIGQQQIQLLRGALLQKDEEYLILLKEYNYLDSLNKEVKDRHAKLLEEYRYLSIQNRTLLNLRGKLADKELECDKLKNERDQFKKKLIELHRRAQQQPEDHDQQHLCSNCKHTQHDLGAGESFFSLSSLSTDRHRSDIHQPDQY